MNPSSRSHKRPRFGDAAAPAGGSNRAGSNRDRIPLDDEYGLVHAREERMRMIGNSYRVVPAQREPQHTTDDWASTKMWTPPDDPHLALDPDGSWYDVAVEADVMEDDDSTFPLTKQKKKRSNVSKRPHVVWMQLHRSTYMDELTRWSGRGDFRTAEKCPDCVARGVESPLPEFRCHECLQADLTCKSCCLKRHRVHPLHRIERWTGNRFLKVSLKSIGLKVQLNHASLRCSNPIPCHVDMLVLHTNGIHEVAFEYCGCTRLIPQHIQLLRRQFYPASQIVMKTCASFELMRMLHMLSLTTKASTYDFYRALEKMTVNTGISCPKSRYRGLLRMCLQWRHLKLLKRGGRANVDDGVATTQPGELAILCPSCPRPGVNLPEDWANAPAHLKFLYMTILCMDANFRLKNNLVSNYSQDPGLGIGWAYMVPRVPYEAYVLSRAKDEDISTCVGFQALAKANTKNSAGLRYTGVGAVSCGRSEMVMPTGMGNLQKGERYANMDYIVASALVFVQVLFILISYDIACQWFINLFKRIEADWPQELRPPSSTTITPAIPKLHEPMHNQKDHQVFSLNFIPGVGLTDGEAPERIWGPNNALGNSTKMAGPGSRHDTLDDHFAFWNWLKYIGQGLTLLRRYRAAVRDRNLQVEGHRGLTDALAPALVAKWETMCKVWEDAKFPKKKPNPYETDGVSISEAQVRKTFAEEESKRIAAGGVALHTTTASGFLVSGLEIEEWQRQLRREAKKTKETSTLRQDGSLTEQRNLLRIRIRNWEQISTIYMPGLLQHQADLAARPTPPPSPPSEHPEDAQLWFPSFVAPAFRPTVCQAGLAEMEDTLRTAQCQDALDAVRHILKIKTRMIAFKNRNIRGQRQGTRSRAVIDRVHERARFAAEKYRAARMAKEKLVGPGAWQDSLRVLADGDIRGYQDANRLKPRRARIGIWEDDQVEARSRADEEGRGDMAVDGEEIPDDLLFNEDRSRRDGTGETRRTLSWIWLSSRPVDTNNSDDNDDILRAEWAKSRGRAARTTEEVLLLQEEMRRVLASLEWKAKWWLDRAALRTSISPDLAEGVRALSVTSAETQSSLAASFRVLWKAALKEDEDEEGDDDEGVIAHLSANALDADDDDEGDDEGDEGVEAPGVDVGEDELDAPRPP